MSSSTQNARQAQEALDSNHSQSPLQPIRTNPSPVSQAARHIHPVLLLAVFAFGFDSLVSDPISSMRSALPIAIVVQAAYAFLCLPVIGSQASKASRKPRPGEKKTGADGPRSNMFVAAFLSLLLSIFISPLFHVAMVLCGAPMLTHIPHTFLCALHLSILTLFPVFYVRGSESPSWLAVSSFRAPFDETFGGLVGGVVGAWLGAFPIPLDWDREWQKWPVPILCGVYAGYVVGKVIGGSLVFGKKF